MAKKSAKSSAKKSAKPTTADAQVVLHLYDQRTEEQMRKARRFILLEFFPASYDEFAQLAFAFGTEKQQHLRQVSSYWEQACALAVRGAVHDEVFADFAGEAFVLYAKFQPFLERFRKELNPTAFSNLEKFATATPERRERVRNIQTNILPRLAAVAGAKPAAAAHAS